MGLHPWDARTNRKLNYIYASDGLFAIYVMNNETDTMYYIHKDYLGSYDVITDEHGNVLERLSFDPWGRRRNPVDWTFDNLPANHLFDRGYTGHEHLDVFSLINMNGRVYDPWLGRFLSPDPFVQSPTYSQSYNRYSYCFNNPLKFSDPTGYTAWKFEPADYVATFGVNYNNSIYRINWNICPYRYDWNTQQYYNSKGEVVTYDEVFVNYIQPNSISFNSYISSLISSNRKHSEPRGNQQNQVNATNFLANFKKALLDPGGMMFNGSWEEILSQDEYLWKIGELTYASGEALKQFIAIVTGESTNDLLEAAGIGSVMINRLVLKGFYKNGIFTLTGDFISQIGGTGQFDAIGGDAYNTIMESSWESIYDPNNIYAIRIAGALSALFWLYDYSNGAYFFNRSSPQTGDNWDWYFDGTFSITTTIGGTTFFKYTDIKKNWP